MNPPAKTPSATDSDAPKRARTAKSRARRGSGKGKKAPASEQEPAIDEVLTNLEQIVKQLEGGELPLELALERFESGVRLARRGSALLDAVEQRVEVLLEGRDETAPFSTPDEQEREDD